MSRKFRGRFMNLLTRRLKEKGITIPQAIRKECFDKNWVIHAKPFRQNTSLWHTFSLQPRETALHTAAT